MSAPVGRWPLGGGRSPHGHGDVSGVMAGSAARTASERLHRSKLTKPCACNTLPVAPDHSSLRLVCGKSRRDNPARPLASAQGPAWSRGRCLATGAPVLGTDGPPTPLPGTPTALPLDTCLDEEATVHHVRCRPARPPPCLWPAGPRTPTAPRCQSRKRHSTFPQEGSEAQGRSVTCVGPLGSLGGPGP